MSDLVHLVRMTVDIVQVIGSTSALVERGNGLYWCVCPFHHEKRYDGLSFLDQHKEAPREDLVVNRERKIYRCFGCEARGDALEFVMRRDRVTLEAAAELISKTFHVEKKREILW